MITSLCSKDDMQISTNDKNKILENFEKIESVLPQIHGDRKRMVNINFILKQIFKEIKLLYRNILISKSKRTFI